MRFIYVSVVPRDTIVQASTFIEHPVISDMFASIEVTHCLTVRLKA